MKKNIKQGSGFCLSQDYLPGTYFYPAMTDKRERKICIAVAFKMNYCIKKANQFLALDSDLDFIPINKVRVGKLKACEKSNISKPFSKYDL